MCSEVPEFGPAAHALLDRLATSFSVEEAQEVRAGPDVRQRDGCRLPARNGLQQRSSLRVPFNSAASSAAPTPLPVAHRRTNPIGCLAAAGEGH